jgi:molybdopterin molybdotransferase
MTFPYQDMTNAVRKARSLVTFDQAVQIICDHAVPLGKELITLDHAAGRVLGEDIVAGSDVPAGPISAMDGYAVRDRDLGTNPAGLPIAGFSFAGHPFSTALPSGHCVRVFTGAAVPSGTERVILQEDVLEKDNVAHFHRPLVASRHIRASGCDFGKGDIIVPHGAVLTPPALVGVAGADRAAVKVYRKPLVAIICCGDELVPPGQNHRLPDTIPESNSYGVCALVEQWGGLVVQRCRRSDDLPGLRRTAATALAASDIVVVIAGASVGDKDFAKAAFADPGFELLFSKAAIKPGKPTWFGRHGKSLVLGLPGNPSAAMVTARLFLAPLVAGLCGRAAADAWNWGWMRTASTLEGDADRDVFLRATVSGRIAAAVTDQASASQRSLARTTHLIRCRAGALDIPASATVETLQL